MFAWFALLFRSWADAGLRARVEGLETAIEQERAKNRILAVLVEQQAEVIERDRARIKAETASHVREAARNV